MDRCKPVMGAVMLSAQYRTLESQVLRAGILAPSVREAAEEVPVAVIHDGSTHAVLMATPSDLVDLALGFSFTEGIITTATDVREIEVDRKSVV